jgi:hypothetical protein|tara:strand:- start:54 stop:443 length:390 start_codon:yes stop_codon:yes gene_type:complete
MSNDKSNNELVRELLEAFSSLKAKMEDPNYIQLEASIKQVIGNQNDMKEDVSELKKRLLNPYDGAIVEISKNTDWRKQQERDSRDFEKLVDEHKSLIQWKSTYTKIFWTLFTAAIGVIGYMVTNLTLNQ